VSGLRAYWLLLVWQHERFRRFLPMIVVIQVALAFGMVYGLAFLIPNIDPRTALYLATGAPTITLMVMGLTIVPQEVSQGKLTGRFDYLSTLPIPRLATLASDVTFWLLAQLPGTVLALVVSSLRFDFALRIGWTLVPTIVLVAFTAACVGYALAMVLAPQVAQQLTSFISIGLLLFSPVNFPMERLPGALQAVHRVLPVTYMGDLMRYGLTGGNIERPGMTFAIVAAWCAAGLFVSYRVAVRRV
jgi:ABC-2 type transport system permease protein